jgi:hypothetical protein
MNEPNPQLLELYGTEKLATKAAAEGVPTAVRFAAALLGFGLLMGQRSAITAAQEEAEQEEELARLMEANRMRPTIDALTKQSQARNLAVGIGRYMAKVAALNTAIEKLAQGVELTPSEKELALHHLVVKQAQSSDSLTEMEKQAIGAMLAGAARGVGRLMGKAPGAVGRAGRRVEAAGIPTLPGSAVSAAPPPIPAAARPVPRMRGVGPETGPPTISLTGAMPGTGRVPSAPPPAAARPSTAIVPTRQAALSKRIVPEREAALARRPAAAAPARDVGGDIVQATQQAGGGGGGLGWKGKLIGAGVLAGTGYAGLQAARTARDYMMIPTQQQTHRGWGARPRTMVSQFGY